jgi:hypothetical protein
VQADFQTNRATYCSGPQGASKGLQKSGHGTVMLLVRFCPFGGSKNITNLIIAQGGILRTILRFTTLMFLISRRRTFVDQVICLDYSICSENVQLGSFWRQASSHQCQQPLGRRKQLHSEWQADEWQAPLAWGAGLSMIASFVDRRFQLDSVSNCKAGSKV